MVEKHEITKFIYGATTDRSETHSIMIQDNNQVTFISQPDENGFVHVKFEDGSINWIKAPYMKLFFE